MSHLKYLRDHVKKQKGMNQLTFNAFSITWYTPNIIISTHNQDEKSWRYLTFLYSCGFFGGRYEVFEVGMHLHLSPMSGGPCLASGSCIGLLSPDLRLLLGLRAAPLPTSTAFPGGWAPIMVKEGAIDVGELRGPGCKLGVAGKYRRFWKLSGSPGLFFYLTQ